MIRPRALLALASLAIACKPPAAGVRSAPITWPADARYPDHCPAMAIQPGEYATLTLVSAHHAEPHLLLSRCDDATLPACEVEFCSPARRAPNAFCDAQDAAERRLYASPAGPNGPAAGSQIIAEPFCIGDRCELALALDVLGSDGSVARRADCRLLAGEIRFEDRPGADAGEDFRDLVLRCEVDREDGSDARRDCYPVY